MQPWCRRKEKGGRCRVTPQLRRPAKRCCMDLLMCCFLFLNNRCAAVSAVVQWNWMAQFDGRWWPSTQVGLLLDCLRCSAGQYLSDPCVWHMATWPDRMGPTLQNLRLANRHKQLRNPKNYLNWGTVLVPIFDNFSSFFSAILGCKLLINCP